MQIGELTAGIACLCTILLKKDISNIPLLLFFQFIFCSASAAHNPIFQSIINFGVDEKRIARFNSYISVTENIVAVSAPALIGIFLQFISNNALLAIISGLYVASYLIINLLDYNHIKNDTVLNFAATFSALDDGFKFIKENKTVLSFTVLFFCSNFSYHFFSSNYLYYLKTHFNLNPNSISYYYIPSGIISIICAFCTPFFIKHFKTHQIVRTVQIIIGLALLFLSITNSIFYTSLLYSISTGITPIIVVAYFTLRQKIVPKEILSRTVSLSRMITHGAIPLGAITGGYVFEKTNNFHLLVAI